MTVSVDAEFISVFLLMLRELPELVYVISSGAGGSGDSWSPWHGGMDATYL